MAKKKAKTRKTAKKSRKFSLKLDRQQKVVLGSFLMLFGLALIVAFVSFLFNWQADQSTLNEFGNRSVEARNWLSKFGATVSDFSSIKVLESPVSPSPSWCFLPASIYSSEEIAAIFENSGSGAFW